MSREEVSQDQLVRLCRRELRHLPVGASHEIAAEVVDGRDLRLRDLVAHPRQSFEGERFSAPCAPTEIDEVGEHLSHGVLPRIVAVLHQTVNQDVCGEDLFRWQGESATRFVEWLEQAAVFQIGEGE